MQDNVVVDGFGVTAGLLAIGVVISTATLAPSIDTYVGASSQVSGGTITVQSRHNETDAGPITTQGATATAQAPGGGIISGQGAVPTASANATLDTHVDAGATLSCHRAQSRSTRRPPTSRPQPPKADVDRRAGDWGERGERNGRRVVQARTWTARSSPAPLLMVQATATQTATTVAEASGGGLISPHFAPGIRRGVPLHPGVRWATVRA